MSMVKGTAIELFRRFRFLLSVGDQTHGLVMAKDTVHGLELGRAHFPGRPSIMGLFQELPEDAELEIVMMSRTEEGPERRIKYHLGLNMSEAVHLAIDLDNAKDGIAMERVLLPEARLLKIIDTKCRFPTELKPLDNPIELKLKPLDIDYEPRDIEEFRK